MKRTLGSAFLLICGFLVWSSFEPTLTPRIEVGRGQSQEIAEAFLAEQGANLANYHHSVVFEHAGRNLNFLERSLGQQALENLIDNPVHTFWWEHRWFADGVIEEYKLAIGLNGRVTFYWRKLSEQAPGPNLEREQALEIASTFLQSQGVPLESLTALDSSSEAHPNRTDHTFSWRLTDFDAAKAQYRYDVWIQGEEVGLYREYLDRPESWDREYSELRARNLAANEVAGTFGSLLECLVVLAFLAHLVKGETSLKELNIPNGTWREWMLSWKKSWVLSWQLLGQSYVARVFFLTALIVALGQINQLPLSLHGHDTSRPYLESVVGALMKGIAASVAMAFWFSLLVWCCGVLTRQAFPQRTPYQRLFSWRALRTEGVLDQISVGLVLMGLHGITFLTFYEFAERLGAWSPLPVVYGGLLTGYLPWATALNVGFVAALGEELVYRVFAISWLKRLGAPNAVAVVIPAAMWGFQHCFYPQQPFFIRGVELTLIGIMYGAVYLRWGLLPCLVSHFTWNAYATGSVLIKSSDPYLIVSGVACAGVALWALLLGRFLQRRFGPASAEPHWQSEGPGPSPELEPAEAPGRVGGLAATVAVLALSLVVFNCLKIPPIESISVTPAQAVTAARTEARARGLSLEGVRETVRLYASWGSTGEYLWERGGPGMLGQLYPKHLSSALWEVRFFRLGEQEEIFVRVSGSSGSVLYFSHEIGEEANGANLSESEAEAIARTLLEQRQGRPSGELRGAESTVRKNRTDYEFTFFVPDTEQLDLGEARLLESVTVRGDQAQRYFPYLDLPEDWLRRKNWTNWWEHLGKLMVATPLALLTLFGIILAFKRVVGSDIRVRSLTRVGAAVLAASLLASLNQLPYRWVDYRTEEHAWSYLASTMSEEIESWIVVLAGLVIGWAGAAILAPRWLVSSTAQTRSALKLGWVAALIRCGLEVYRYLVCAKLHPWLGLELASVPNPVRFLPFLDSLLGAFLVGTFLTLFLGWVVGLIRASKAGWIWLAGFSLALGLILDSAEQAIAIGPRFFFHGAGMVMVVWFWKRLLKANAWAWFHFFFLYTALEECLAYLPHPAFRLQGILILVSLAIWSAAWWWFTRVDSKE